MDVVTTSLDHVGARKAAILVASLEQSAADALLDRLHPEQADLVRQTAMALDEVGPDERQRVIEEFRRIGPMVPDQSPPGIELDGLTSDVTPGVAAAPPFEFLSGAEDERLAQLLRGERPPTVALVLSHLPPDRAGEVLACLAPTMQVEVVRRLAEVEDADPEPVREVERALESRWSKQFDARGESSPGGPGAVDRILAACDPHMRGRILANLAAHDQPLAERFGHRCIAFDDLARCDDAALRAVLRAAEPEVTQAALLGASPAVLERFLHCLPAEDAKTLRHKLDNPEPIRLSDVEEARLRIAALAQRLYPVAADKTAA
jgi:flagellar motor switch protein FliG